MTQRPTLLKEIEGRLAAEDRATGVVFTAWPPRPFSCIYEAAGIRDGRPAQYIVKIGRERGSAERECKALTEVRAKGIRCIEPVFYSSERNYLVTRKEAALSLEASIRRRGAGSTDGVRKLAGILARLNSGVTSAFDAGRFLAYTLPRLGRIRCLTKAERSLAGEVVQDLARRTAGRQLPDALVTDLSFCNMLIGRDGEIVLADLADADQGSAYENAAFVYLELKFGILNRFIENARLTAELAGPVLAACGVPGPDDGAFIIFQLKLLINQLLFLETRLQQPVSVARLCSDVIDLVRRKRYFIRLLSRYTKQETCAPHYDYTDLAAAYDSERYCSAADAFIDSLRARALKSLVCPEGKTLLDVATGTGSGLVFMSGPGRKVVGVDATLAMLEEARKKIASLRLDNVVLVRGDAGALPGKDGAFDAVMSLNFLHLFASSGKQERFVQEMARVVKPGGCVVIELDNALHGGILGIIRKYTGNDIGYNWPWDSIRLGKGMKLDRIVGVCLPGTKRLFRVNSRWAERYAGLATRFPWKYLANRLLVRYVKS